MHNFRYCEKRALKHAVKGRMLRIIGCREFILVLQARVLGDKMASGEVKNAVNARTVRYIGTYLGI